MKEKTIRILIVDDDEATREILASVFSDNGFTVFQADSGRDALTCLGENPVDLVLSDIQMPKGNGYELLAELSKNRSSLKIVLMTGDIGIVNRERTAGALGVLEKPLDLRNIIDKVRDLYRRAGSGS